MREQFLGKQPAFGHLESQFSDIRSADTYAIWSLRTHHSLVVSTVSSGPQKILLRIEAELALKIFVAFKSSEAEPGLVSAAVEFPAIIRQDTGFENGMVHRANKVIRTLYTLIAGDSSDTKADPLLKFHERSISMLSKAKEALIDHEGWNKLEDLVENGHLTVSMGIP